MELFCSYPSELRLEDPRQRSPPTHIRRLNTRPASPPTVPRIHLEDDDNKMKISTSMTNLKPIGWIGKTQLFLIELPPRIRHPWVLKVPRVVFMISCGVVNLLLECL